jgi:hypothetical protein
MFRRLLTLALLIAFGSPLVAPLFAASPDSQSNLPACCRRHGTHHCAMPATAQDGPSDHVFQAPPCPFYPTAPAQLRISAASFAAPSQATAEFPANEAPRTPATRRTQTFAASAHLTRGPPAYLA